MTSVWKVVRNAPALAAGLLLAGPGAAREPETKDIHWPSFRGENARGVADGFATPTSWDVTKKQSVRWKTPIPGLGHGSPIVWGDRVYVCTAISGKKDPYLRVGLYGDVNPVSDDTKHQWRIYCLDKRTGKIVWQSTAFVGVPKIMRHTKATHANSTLATDGKNVIAMFGSEGLYCYNAAGKLRWKKDLGTLDAGWYVMPAAQWGFGSSPVIHGDRVILQCDVQKGSFIAAFRLSDGSQIWRTPRNDVPSWGSPTIYKEGGRTLAVVNGYKHIGAYELATGQEVWKLKGGGDIPVPTPIVAHGLIYITNAHGMMAPIYAIKTTAAGDVSLEGDATSNSGVAWSYRRDGGYMQTPLVYGDHLYVCRDHGVLSCYEAKTGKRLYNERLTTSFTGFTASGVAADGKLYYTSEEGDVYVVQAGPEFKVLSKNPLGEICMATPAISEGALFFRTRDHLVAVAKMK